MLDHFVLHAGYNQWMNGNLHRAASGMPAEELAAPRGAFFDSILGTLNHLVVADTIWLKRFAAADEADRWSALRPMRGEPMPASLDARPCPDLEAWWNRRQALDALIVDWIGQLDAADLDRTIAYATMRGDPHRKRLAHLLLHFFNHQTHHRGQATTLFSQAGVDVGPTDLLLRIPTAP
jgi:Uncharacterized protein conserved in bacteria